MGAGSSNIKSEKPKIRVIETKTLEEPKTKIEEPKKLTKKQKKVILDQQSNSLCQIVTKEGNFIGFLCKIPNTVLITSNHALNESQIKSGKEIDIIFTDEDNKKHQKKIKIDETRKTYTIGKFDEVEIDTTIIELKIDEDNLNDQEFMEIDTNLMNENVENLYKKEDVYLIYEKSEKFPMSTGIIKEIEKKNKVYTLFHNCDTNNDSIDCPIFLFNHKVIGINKGHVPNEKYNKAILLQFPIKEFINKLGQKEKINAKKNVDEENENNTAENDNNKNKNKEKNSNEINKIIMTYYDSSDTRVLGRKFVKNNRENCKFLINKKKYDICEYLEYDYDFDINEVSDREFTITLIVTNPEKFTDLSYMFSGCKNLCSLDLSSFNTDNVTNMSHMFYDCYEFLHSLDLSSFNTKNVTNMSYMFAKGDCPISYLGKLNVSSFNTEKVTNMEGMFIGNKIYSLNLKSFNTQNVTNMSSMFCDTSLKSLDLSSFNTQNVTDMSYMFANCFELTSINLSSFNTKKVVDMRGMFNNSRLNSLNLKSFDATNAEINGMFKYSSISFCDCFDKKIIDEFNEKSVY